MDKFKPFADNFVIKNTKNVKNKTNNINNINKNKYNTSYHNLQATPKTNNTANSNIPNSHSYHKSVYLKNKVNK